MRKYANEISRIYAYFSLLLWENGGKLNVILLLFIFCKIQIMKKKKTITHHLY